MTTNTTVKAAPALKRTATGMVDSICGLKSVRVRVDRLVRHPLYGKYLKRSTRLMVHDEARSAGVGDTVEIAPCRPLSKRKAWRLVKVLKKSGQQAPVGSR